jgi:hypothetical protein
VTVLKRRTNLKDDFPRCIDHLKISELGSWTLGHKPGGVCRVLVAYLYFGKRGEEWKTPFNMFLHRLVGEFGDLGEALEFEILRDKWLDIIEIEGAIGVFEILDNPQLRSSSVKAGHLECAEL